MKLPPAPVRRAVLCPLWVPVAAAVGLLLLAVTALGGLAWPVASKRWVPRLALLGAVYVTLDACLMLACTGVWLRHPVAARRDQDRWVEAHLRLLRWTLRALRAAVGALLGFRVRVEEPPDAAELPATPLLVLARHAGPGDSFTLVDLLLSRYGRRPRIVLKEELQWDPGLDVLLNRLGACFLAPAGDDRTAQLASVARELRGRDAMLIFPEGRNWTPLRYRRALARLRREVGRRAATEAARNRHVLPPRPAGVQACLAARPDLDVVVVAHTGLEDLVSPALLWRALPLTDRPMTVRWWYEPAAKVPSDPDEQTQWLQVQWAIVDSWIDARQARAQEPAAQDAGLLESPG
jgi:1-acyl-sn-glycerol-3-phosphate acyltransferase